MSLSYLSVKSFRKRLRGYSTRQLRDIRVRLTAKLTTLWKYQRGRTWVDDMWCDHRDKLQEHIRSLDTELQRRQQ